MHGAGQRDPEYGVRQLAAGVEFAKDNPVSALPEYQSYFEFLRSFRDHPDSYKPIQLESIEYLQRNVQQINSHFFKAHSLLVLGEYFWEVRKDASLAKEYVRMARDAADDKGLGEQMSDVDRSKFISAVDAYVEKIRL